MAWCPPKCKNSIQSGIEKHLASTWHHEASAATDEQILHGIALPPKQDPKNLKEKPNPFPIIATWIDFLSGLHLLGHATRFKCCQIFPVMLGNS